MKTLSFVFGSLLCLASAAYAADKAEPAKAPAAAAPAAAPTPAPKADAPKADAPKADAPKADAPKADAPDKNACKATDADGSVIATATSPKSTECKTKIKDAVKTAKCTGDTKSVKFTYQRGTGKAAAMSVTCPKPATAAAPATK